MRVPMLSYSVVDMMPRQCLLPVVPLVFDEDVVAVSAKKLARLKCLNMMILDSADREVSNKQEDPNLWAFLKHPVMRQEAPPGHAEDLELNNERQDVFEKNPD
jgi:hypothetical protein